MDSCGFIALGNNLDYLGRNWTDSRGKGAPLSGSQSRYCTALHCVTAEEPAAAMCVCSK